MINRIDVDENESKTPLLPFPPEQLDRSVLRMTRAQFAAFLGISKQAVSQWVKLGKISIGADGLLDPRQAVSQLLRSTDPSRLRTKVLAPLLREQASLQRQVDDLRSELSSAKEEWDFYEECSNEMIALLRTLQSRLRDELITLKPVEGKALADAMDQWIDKSFEYGVDPDIAIHDYLRSTPPDALEKKLKEGEPTAGFEHSSPEDGEKNSDNVISTDITRSEGNEDAGDE